MIVDLQAALAASDSKGKDLDVEQAGKLKIEENLADEKQNRLEHVEAVTDQMCSLSVSSASEVASPSANQIENSGPDIDKRIRALKKKVRFKPFCILWKLFSNFLGSIAKQVKF